MDRTFKLGPVQRPDPARTQDTPAAAEQFPQPTPQTDQTPGAVLERLRGERAAGTSQGTSFRPSSSEPVPDDRLDTMSQQLRNRGFTLPQIDAVGNYERMSKLAEVSGAIRLGPGKFTRDMLVHVAKTEGVEGLQALYDMGTHPDATNLLTQKADAIRAAMRGI